MTDNELMDQLKKIVAELNTQGKMIFLEGVSEEQINVYENRHNILLPQKYKAWLRYTDGGECFLPAGVQFYGVAHKPLLNPDDDDKPNDSYTVIGALASGDPILCEKNSERISIYNHEVGRIEVDEIYPDFFEFLIDLHNILGIGD